MENLLRIALIVVALLIAVGVAAAQSWAGSEGSSILRVDPLGLQDPFERPRLYFLGRPEKLLPPAYSAIYPFGEVRVRMGRNVVVREFLPLDRNGRETVARIPARAVAAQTRGYRTRSRAGR